jgi:hypothetical protein
MKPPVTLRQRTLQSQHPGCLKVTLSPNKEISKHHYVYFRQDYVVAQQPRKISENTFYEFTFILWILIIYIIEFYNRSITLSLGNRRGATEEDIDSYTPAIWVGTKANC